MRAAADRCTVAGSVACRATRSRAASTGPVAGFPARWWQIPSRARRSSTSSRLTGEDSATAPTRGAPMPPPDAAARIATLLHEAAETHHTVYRIVDGEDPDWASWYADWLLNLSELPDLVGVRPVRSHLVHALVELDRDASGMGRWEDAYAAGLLERFGAG